MSAIIKIPQSIHFRLEDHDPGESIELLGDEPGAPAVGQVYNIYDLPCLEEEQTEEMDACAKAIAERMVKAYNGYGRPIDLLLYCPNCGAQHIDEARPDVCETCGSPGPECTCSTFTAWLNPPHKSHRCENCNYVWRPADVPTNGVAALKTKGERDSDPIPRLTTGSLGSLMEELECEQSALYANDSYVLGLGFALQRIGELAGINPDLGPKGEPK